VSIVQREEVLNQGRGPSALQYRFIPVPERSGDGSDLGVDGAHGAGVVKVVFVLAHVRRALLRGHGAEQDVHLLERLALHAGSARARE
jgi:hypothetical protein